jgi:Flp pilus assembly protein TadG
MSHLSHPRPAPRRAARGQAVVFFALMSLVLLGVLGLALDGGYLLAKRRMMQTAADAAALAGATALAGNNAGSFTVLSTVREVAQQNGVQDPTSASQLTCTYLDNNLEPLASPLPSSCNDSPFATGTAVSAVRVTVSESHPTFVLRALGIGTSGAGATATAQVQRMTTLDNAQVAWLPCGLDTKRVDANGNTVDPMSILVTTGEHLYYNPGDANLLTYTAAWQDTTGKVKIDPNAYGYDAQGSNRPGGSTLSPNPYRFLLHKASGNDTNGITRCSADGYAAWKGYNGVLTGTIDITQTLPLQGAASYLPDYAATSPDHNSASYTSGLGALVVAGTGQRSGPALTVPGAGGCAPGQESDCIMLLPILDNSVGSGNGSNGILAARELAPFYITTNASHNEHYGTLVANWHPNVKGSATFTAGSSGITSIVLVR